MLLVLPLDLFIGSIDSERIIVGETPLISSLHENAGLWDCSGYSECRKREHLKSNKKILKILLETLQGVHG